MPQNPQQLLKINFQNFVFCLRCHFIRVNLKVQRCKGESAKLHRHRRDSIIAPSCFAYSSHSHLCNFALSHLRPKGECTKFEVAPSEHHKMEQDTTGKSLIHTLSFPFPSEISIPPSRNLTQASSIHSLALFCSPMQ